MTGPSNVPGSFRAPRNASALSPRQMEALRSFAEMGDQHRAAKRMGISYQTLKNHLRWAYLALGVHSAIDAFRVLGWLRVP